MTGSPGIFIDELWRDDSTDRRYAVIGRAVWLATRFEGGCKTLSIMLGLKGGRLHAQAFDEGVDYIEALETFAKAEREKQLNAAVQNVARHLNSPDAVNILHAARRARNDVAHDLAAGFDYAVTEPELCERRYAALRVAVGAIAEGDKLVSILLSLLNNDPLLNHTALAKYVADVTAWVCEPEPNRGMPPN